MASVASTRPATRLGQRRQRLDWQQYLLWLVLGLGSVLMIAPFYWTLVTSFKSRSEVRAFPPTWWPREPTFEHWIKLSDLNVGSFSDFYRNSLIVASSVTVLVLLTSALVGYVLAKHRFYGRDFILVMILSMLMIPFNISIIPLYALIVDMKWSNTLWALIIPSAYSPFGIFLMRQFMQGIPDELLDAARIDGATEYNIFFKIILPLSTAPLAALGIFTFTWQWDDFLWPLVVINEPELYTLPLGLSQFRGRVGTDVGGLAAASMAAVVPVLVVYFIAQRRIIEGITFTGLKG